jgi:hypothetical protein
MLCVIHHTAVNSRCPLRLHLPLGCGDVADITNNGGTQAAETDCATACSGDPLHLCGGAERLQLYLWKGSLNNWQTPANIGKYEVRIAFMNAYVR